MVVSVVGVLRCASRSLSIEGIVIDDRPPLRNVLFAHALVCPLLQRKEYTPNEALVFFSLIGSPFLLVLSSLGGGRIGSRFNTS